METLNSVYDLYKLKEWVDPKKINWRDLVFKKNAIPFIEKHIGLLDKCVLKVLSRNPFAVEMLEKHIDKISWNDFVNNPNSIHVVEKNIDVCLNSLDWRGQIDLLRHPNFIHIINTNTDKILDKLLSINCLSILACQQNEGYIDLLDKFMKKYPEKIPIVQSSHFWNSLCENPNAIHIIEQHLDKLTNYSWQILAKNPSAIPILEKNTDRLGESGWRNLSGNFNAIPILEKNIDKIDWFSLSSNINGYKLLEKYPENIKFYLFFDYDNLSVNCGIFDLDYEAIRKRCSVYKEELLAIALHPYRIEAYLKQGIPIEELDKYI